MPNSCAHSLKFNGNAFSIFEKFKNEQNVFFLDSSLKGRSSQFSYLGFAPFKTLVGDDLSVLRREFAKHRTQKSSLPFSGGVVGYISYEGDFFFGFYNSVIVFDHAKDRLIIHAPTQKQIDAIVEKINAAPQLINRKILKSKIQFKSNFSKTQYTNTVRDALRHIRDGDIYQLNLSQKIQAGVKNWQSYTDAAEIYGELRKQSPSPFSAYFDDGQQYVLSSSPERFLKLSGKTVEVRPMKGTRPRGKTRAQDQGFKTQLLKSPKEIAELLMVTDLERNDLGRICDYGSVKVASMRTIEKYKTVFQATSTVQGQLNKKYDQFDLLKATFPSGSVTGCPKIEAMKIIKKLERQPRGVYTGSLGYISFSGGMDFNVLIRTLVLQKDSIHFHVGGGIVADSKPIDEYKETWTKAQAMMDALNLALGGKK